MNNRLKDFWTRIICIPLFPLLVAIIGNFEEFIIQGNISWWTLYYFLLLTLISFIIWHINRYIHLRVKKHHKRLTNEDDLTKGLGLRLVLYGLNPLAIVLIVSLIVSEPKDNYIVH